MEFFDSVSNFGLLRNPLAEITPSVNPILIAILCLNSFYIPDAYLSLSAW